MQTDDIERLKSEVQRLTAAVQELQRSRQAPVRRRRHRWAFAAVVTFATVSLAQLVSFSPDTPAKADEVNANFQQLKSWLEAKVGTVGQPLSATSVAASSVTVGSGGVNVTAGGVNVTAGGMNVTGATTITGATTVTGPLTVRGPLATGCPTTFPRGGGAVTMVDMGAYCIQTEFDSNNQRGAKSWLATNTDCVGKGLRMCTFAEVSAAAFGSNIRTYDFAQAPPNGGDAWAWVDQTASDSNSPGFGGCHVNLNTNRSGILRGEINCAVDGTAPTSVIGGLCCL